MNFLKSRTREAGSSPARRRLLRKAVLSTTIAVMLLAVALLTGPYVGSKLSSILPRGTIEIKGRELTTQQKDAALAVLMSDPEVKELLRQGAAIPPNRILSLEVVLSKVNSETGKIEKVTEIWAEAQIMLGVQKYSAQVDLVGEKVLSISGSTAKRADAGQQIADFLD